MAGEEGRGGEGPEAGTPPRSRLSFRRLTGLPYRNRSSASPEDGCLFELTSRPSKDPTGVAWYLVCMKRTNLVLDEQLLEEVTRFSGERTYSRAVSRAWRATFGGTVQAVSSSWPGPSCGKATCQR